jgi:hypothetical protein
MDSVPGKGTKDGEFYHRSENPFRDVDQAKQPPTYEAEEELETNVCLARSGADDRMCSLKR